MAMRYLPALPDGPDLSSGVCYDNPHSTWMFFSNDRGVKAMAKQMCQRCPVQVACDEYAMAVMPQGIWGGQDEQDRNRRRRSAPVVVRRSTCGSLQGAAIHRSRSETLCDGCKKAEDAYERQAR